MDGSWNIDPLTGRVTRLELFATSAADELLLTRLYDVFRSCDPRNSIEAILNDSRIIWRPEPTKSDCPEG